MKRSVEVIERKLSGRLEQLQKRLRANDAKTTERLPADEEEAAPIINEMSVIESEEKSEAAAIRLIEAALKRLKQGTYGICLSCKKAISEQRLEAVPEAPNCIDCQKASEKKSR